MKECKYQKEQSKCPNFDNHRKDKKRCIHNRFDKYCGCCSGDNSYKKEV